MVALLLFWSVSISTTVDQDIGFDYKAFIKNHMDLVADGSSDKAIDLLEQSALTPAMFGQSGRAEIRKRFAFLAESGGKYLGQEVVGYRRVGTRLIRFYSIAYFEKALVVNSYLFMLNDGKWKIVNYTLSDKLDDVEKQIPFMPIPKDR